MALAQHSAFCAEKELELSLGRGEPFTMGARQNRPNTRHLMTKGVTTRNILRAAAPAADPGRIGNESNQPQYNAYI